MNFNLIAFIYIIIASSLAKALNENEIVRNWEVICSILSCKSVLDRCIQNQCLGADQCRNCVLSKNKICSRCVDSILNEQFNTMNGTQTIICDSSNSLHETT
jgi:hypothetical protein